MSLKQHARADSLTLERSRRPSATALSTRLNRVLFSTRRWPWLALDMGLALVLYEVGIRLSPYGGYAEIVSPYVALSVVYALAFGALALGLGAYDRDRRFDYFAIVRTAAVATLLASLINLAFHYFTLYEVVGRLTLVYGAAFSFAGIVAARSALTWSVRQRPYRFSVIGGSKAVGEVLSEWMVNGDRSRMHVLVPWESIFVNPHRPTVEELTAANIAEIVVAEEAMSDQEAIDFALLSIQANVPTVDERTFYAQLFERLPIDEVSKRWILEEGIARPQGVVVAMKRLGDVVVAGIGLTALLPVMVLVALAVGLSGPGPVLFVQTRQGRFMRPFEMFKFRTMRNAPEASDAGFTAVDDHRVTRVGRILRRTHLDEVPQLFNILRGDMSLVGPRPEALDFAHRMNEELPLYELRYLVRPGLAGHAQLKQGYAMDTLLDTRLKLSYDLYYLCNYSIRMDLRILLRTLLFLLKGSR